MNKYRFASRIIVRYIITEDIRSKLLKLEKAKKTGIMTMSAAEFDDPFWIVDKNDLRKNVIDQAILRTRILQDRVKKQEIDLSLIKNYENIQAK